MELYRARHVVENVFQRLKMFKRVASRFEKTKRMFFAFICVVMAAIYIADILWQPMSTIPNKSNRLHKTAAFDSDRKNSQKSAVQIKTYLACLFLLQSTVFATLTPGDIRYLLSAEPGGLDSDKQLLAKISKEDTFQWAELVKTNNVVSDLARISIFTTFKYEEYENVYTEKEKALLAQLIIEGVEKQIALRESYGPLGRISRLDHPLTDDLIERLKPIALTNRDCKSALESLMIGLAAKRAEKAAQLAASNTAGPVPPPFSIPPPTSATSTRTPVPVQLPRAAPVRNPIWLWAAAACMALPLLIWRIKRASRRAS